MADLEDIRKQIRYQLSRLSTENEHHSFEHLCRFIGRYRICSNILPATGPVSKGGDEGRDFETFRTYLTEHPVGERWFLGLVSDSPLAFACSLTKKESIAAKIRADVRTIKDFGERVEGVHYFCEAPIAISERHKLRAWAREQMIALEVYDGDAIAEFLLSPDTYWLAVHYLGAPETYPPFASTDDGWYEERRLAWEGVTDPSGLADYDELRAYARYALHQEDRRPDLPFWLGKLRQLAEADGNAGVRRRAIGELAALAMWAQKSLEGLEPLIRQQFSAPDGYADAFDASHAVYALNFVLAGVQRNVCMIERTEIGEWRSQLGRAIDEHLGLAIRPAERAGWLDALGFFTFAPDAFTDMPADPERAFKAWKDLLAILDDAPLFPITKLARFFEKVIPFAGSHRDYRSLVAEIDAAVAKRAGAIAAGEIARDRAVKFYEGKDLVRALDQLHGARERWFTDEALDASVLATLVASGWYRELGLCFAAKYYALSAALTALTSNDPDTRGHLPDALRLDIEAEYHQGAWLSMFEMLPASIAAADAVMTSAEDEPPEALKRVILCAARALSMTRRVGPAFYKYISERLAEFPMRNIVELLAAEQPPWTTLSDDQLRASLAASLAGKPYSDAGVTRVVRWNALGIEWVVEWPNTYVVNRIGEQFCASLQIVIAHVALDTNRLNDSPSFRVAITPAPDDATFELAMDNVGEDYSRSSWSLSAPLSAADASSFSFEKTIQRFITTLVAAALGSSEPEYKRLQAAGNAPDVAAKILIGTQPLRKLLIAFSPPERFGEEIRHHARHDASA